jgi:hypothetical protein
MPNEMKEPSENDDISCHLQDIGMGTLICRAAKQTGEHNTNEVNETICFNCPVGKIYREFGCDAITPNIRIYHFNSFHIHSLFCKIRKRTTDFDYCKNCGLPVAETTRQIVTTAKGLFEKYGFFSAHKDIEKARKAIRDGKFENAVTHSISCLESTMQICHDELGKPLPNKKQVSDLWKSSRNILEFNRMDSTGAAENLLNSLSGVMTHLGDLRNSLSDAHGKGKISPEVSESIAELAINIASGLSTAIIRRYKQIKGDKHE